MHPVTLSAPGSEKGNNKRARSEEDEEEEEEEVVAEEKRGNNRKKVRRKKNLRPLSTYFSILNPTYRLFSDQGARNSQRGECCKAEGFCEHTIPRNTLTRCRQKNMTVADLSRAENWLMWSVAKPAVKEKLLLDFRLVGDVVDLFGGKNGLISQSVLLKSYQQEATRVILQ